MKNAIVGLWEILTRKISSAIISFLCVLSALFLFLPDNLMMQLNLDGFRQSYGSIVRWVFIVSAAMLFVTFLAFILKSLGAMIIGALHRKVMRETVARLDESDKAVLFKFYVQKKETLNLPVDDPTVALLLREGVLVRVEQLDEDVPAGSVFPVQISGLARRYISKESMGPATGAVDDER